MSRHVIRLISMVVLFGVMFSMIACSSSTEQPQATTTTTAAATTTKAVTGLTP